MKLQFIDPGNISVSKANMRQCKTAPDVSDILPSVRARAHRSGSPAASADEIVAGARRVHAALIVADEHHKAGLESACSRSATSCRAFATFMADY